MGFYDPPQPQQRRVFVPQIGTPGSQPPVKTIAALTAIVASWPSVYDHTPYLGQHPAPAAAILAPFVPLANNPPFALRVPISAKKPGIHYGSTDQYGFTFSGGVNNPTTAPPVVNNPPFALKVPAVSKDPARPFYGLNLQYGFTYLSGAQSVVTPPPVISNPPGIGFAVLAAIRASWPDATWPAQSSAYANEIQPSTGDEPYGFPVPPDLDNFPYPSWGAQSTTRLAAAWIPPPPVSAPPQQTLAVEYSLRGSWPEDRWPAQSAHNPVVALTLTYGQQPPPTNPAQLYATRATWVDPTWADQSEGQSAAISPAPPTPNSIALQMAARSVWPVDQWPAQTFADSAALPPPPPPQQTPYVSPLAPIYLWQPVTWVAQTAPESAGLPVANAPPPKAPSVPTMWPGITWGAQEVGPVTAAIAPNAPPPLGSGPSLLRSTWADQTWGAQRSSLTAGTFVPPPVNNPPPYSTVNQFSANQQWPGIWWPAQSAHASLPLGHLLSGVPHFLVIAQHQPRIIISDRPLMKNTGPLPYGEFYCRVGERESYGIDWTFWLQNQWSPGENVVQGFVVRPSQPNGYQYTCTQPGETGDSEPEWPIGPGATITEGSVLWTCESIDTTSLSTVVSASSWSSQLGVNIIAQSLLGEITGAALDTSAATQGQDYVVQNTITCADGEVKIGVIKLKVR